ncbi:Proline-specific permease [Neolecta irregularis DAH-3]|uniref:Proline-specific permease n=1 Tax=Neolecta irregularis (strain DAH-3) TaxID=1198029 RepID=A0A1U7LGW4_NEOID|nr:Proline-specific permease [Neolecta irregularis DAH-3]|eukprot:OLL21894.1 Proline-specific permease [Neolecta irregularis DAH-3]
MSHKQKEKYEFGALPSPSIAKPIHTAGIIDLSEAQFYGQVQRGLKARHVQFIALGGTIGTGLFVGSANALADGGPLSALMAYSFVGILIFCIMQSLGEMITYLPLPGAVPSLASRYVSEALGFAQGWLYWFSFGITVAVEITAAALVIHYWDPKEIVPVGVWLTVLYVVIIGLNCFGVNLYGESEFWFASLKIVTVVGLLLMSLIVDLGGNPQHDRIGFRYWKDPGPMRTYIDSGSTGRFLGLWKVVTQAAFSYGGTELIAITAGETMNPRRNVPKAIRRVFWRILIFYVLGILAIGVLVPYNDPDMSREIRNGGHGANASPFVIGIKRLGISTLPDIINAVILSSAWSSGNSFVYAGSRTLYSLALDGKAPSIFKKCTKSGVPIFCVGSIALLSLVMYLNVATDSNQVFDWFSNLTTISGFITVMECHSHFLHPFLLWTPSSRYLKIFFTISWTTSTVPGIVFTLVKPFLNFSFALFWTITLAIFSGADKFQHGFDVRGFFASYISIMFFFVMYFGYQITKRPRFVKLEDVDFFTGKERIDVEGSLPLFNGDVLKIRRDNTQRLAWSNDLVWKALGLDCIVLRVSRFLAISTTYICECAYFCKLHYV